MDSVRRLKHSSDNGIKRVQINNEKALYKTDRVTAYIMFVTFRVFYNHFDKELTQWRSQYRGKGQSAPTPFDRENIIKNREKEGKIGKNREKEEKSGLFFHFAPPDK